MKDLVILTMLTSVSVLIAPNDIFECTSLYGLITLLVRIGLR